MNNVDAGLAILRVLIGLTFAAHGVNKFFGGGRIPGTARWFDGIGMRPGRVHAVVAASTETLAGVFFALGLLTSFAAAAMVSVMLVAAWTVHRDAGFFSAGGGWEYNFVLAVVAVGVATTGPGAFSIDRLTGFDLASLWGFTIALGLGLGAGFAQLALFFRPRVAESVSS